MGRIASTRISHAVVLLLVTSLFIFHSGPTAANSGVFTDIPAADRSFLDTQALAARQSSIESRTVIRIRHVNLDVDSILSIAIRPKLEGRSPNPITFNLFDQVSLTVVTVRVWQDSSSDYHWIGYVGGDRSTQAVFVLKNRTMFGTIRVQGRVYEIRPADRGAHAILEIDPSKFPNEAPPRKLSRRHSSTTVPDETEHYSDRRSPSFFVQPVSHPPSSLTCTINVMVVYVNNFLSAPTAMEIKAAIDQANDTFLRSNIQHRLNLVHSQVVSYSGSGDLDRDLTFLQGNTDGEMVDVHSWRDTYNADLVSLWVPNGTVAGEPACGLGWQIDDFIDVSYSAQYGFSVVFRGCATDQISFAHELGHNMGAYHDRDSEPALLNDPGHNFGYVNPNFVLIHNLDFNIEMHSWYTVMAKRDKCVANGWICQRIPYWSNPNVVYNGLAAGATGRSTHPAADNSSVLNSTGSKVAGFRPPNCNQAADTTPPSAPTNLSIQ